MANARLITGTLVDSGTVTASSATASLPATNVQDQQRTKVWRSTSLTSQYLRVAFSANQTFNCIVLCNHNLTANGEVTITAGTSAGDSSLLNETHDAWEPLWGFGLGGFGEHGYGGFLSDEERDIYYPAGSFRLIYFTAGQVRAQYWQIAFSDADNSDSYIEVGRLVLDAYRETSRGVSIGFTNTPEDPSQIQYSLGGQMWRDAQTKFRSAEIGFNAVEGDNAWSLHYALMQEVGAGKSFVVDLFPSSTNLGARLHNQMYCHIPQGSIQPLNVLSTDIVQVRYLLRESR